MMMNGITMWLVLVVLAALIHSPMAVPSQTSPAFLFSPHLHQVLNGKMDEAVAYQTISSRDLAKAVLSQGGWSKLMCSGKKARQPADVALVFVGRELLSSDISANTDTDPVLLNLLKVSFLKSNFSMGFPYIAVSTKESMENSLLMGFQEACGDELETSNVLFSESCSIDGQNIQKLADVKAVHDHLSSRAEKRVDGQTDLVVFCHGGSQSSKRVGKSQSEGEVFSELISSVETLGATYSVLYVSNPFQSILYPSQSNLGRFLAEDTGRNESVKSTGCDELCQIKSSLLEGVLVGIVLLLILISGLCCMMGIDTPTRFESPQES